MMKVERPELLKQWMVATLKPICDAEPSKLARYVLALVRKDRGGTLKQLRCCLLQQLDVFLQERTAAFVDLLLNVLRTGEHLSVEGKPSARPAPATRRIVQLPDTPNGCPAAGRQQRDGCDSPPHAVHFDENASRYRSRSPDRNGLTVATAEEADPRWQSGRLYGHGRGADTAGLADLRHRLSGAALDQRRSRHFQERGVCVADGDCASDGGASALVVAVSAPGLTPFSPPQTAPGPGHEPYSPEAPGLTAAAAAPPPSLPADAGTGSVSDATPKVEGVEQLLSGEAPPSSALSLLVSQVPADANQIMPLNDHFCQFGRVTNVQVAFGGDPETALVTFSNSEEVAAALAAASHQLAGRPVTLQPHAQLEHTQVVLAPSGRLTRTVTTRALQERAESEATAPRQDVAEVRRSQELLAATVSLQTKAKERQLAARELSAELRRRESELLARQLSQQRALLSRLEAPALKPHERAALLQTLKRLQQGTQRTRQTLAETLRRSAGKVPRAHRTAGRTAVSRTASSAHVRQERQEVRRRRELELLDLELELHQRQLAGAETQQLQRRLQLLRASGQSRPPRAGGRGGGRSGPRLTSIDRRPTTLLVTGAGEVTTELVVKHLKRFGAVTDCVTAADGTSLLVTFASRGQAEAARAGAASLGSPQLSVSWAPAPSVAPAAVPQMENGSQETSSPELPSLSEPAADVESDGALLEEDLLADGMSDSDEGLLADSEDEAEALAAEHGGRGWRR